MACMPRHHGFDSLATVGLQKLCGMKVTGSIAAGACLIVVTSCGVLCYDGTRQATSSTTYEPDNTH